MIHAALLTGPASAAFLAKVARLTLYRSGAAAQTTGPTVAGERDANSEIVDTGREQAGVTGRTHE